MIGTTYRPEPALSSGEDPVRYARVLESVYDATMSGRKPPARPRSVIANSWSRLRELGVDPDRCAVTSTVRSSDLEESRREAGMSEILAEALHGLAPIVGPGDANLVVLADRCGRILWRRGPRRMLDRAERLGMVEGALWTEESVGTNGIGTALAAGVAVQVFSAEHYSRSQHPWTCSGAMVRDPRSRRPLAVINVAGAADTVHPSTLALVDGVARLAEAALREQHRKDVDRLRMISAPVLARADGPALVADRDGWVAAVESMAPTYRVGLPTSMSGGEHWLPGLGSCVCEPLPGGWLIRPRTPRDSESECADVELDLRDERSMTLRYSAEVGRWRVDLSLRHAEILFALAERSGGLSAAQLASALFADPSKTVTVRAEMSRLRRRLSGVLDTQPYRFAESVRVTVLRPNVREKFLPSSQAPLILACR
ncbi:hypothetical protein ABH922_000560 [Rhodococcus sp. 27YEA15]|uniref:helix-turn-helix domain-containing protein n=1 Tax=Rhodococcus sp. 27YEA15 TaxID=3156259 RepID=UPI003C79E58B